MLGFKTCSKCRQVNPACFGHFYRQKATSDGYTSWCRDCDRKASRDRKRIARAKGMVKPVAPEKMREYVRSYRERNIELVRERSRKSERKRRDDPQYRLSSNVGRRVREMLRKTEGSCRHLPYTSEELCAHIERQFSDGMSWDNYGAAWHVDHIRPVSSFSFSGPRDPQFIDCWSLTNLRPMLAFDNMSKGSKTTNLI